MRLRTILSITALSMAGAFAPSAAMAGQATPGGGAAPKAATPSVAGYLCTFAGKCDDQVASPQDTIAAPRTKGFRLARPTAASGTPAVSLPRAVSGRQLVGTRAPHPMAYGRTPARLTQPAAPAMTAVPVAVGAGARPRADLMIGFELNSARLSAQGMASGRVFAQSLMMPELANKRFLIEGHTDLRGSRALNLDLSARRAQAVADFLAAQGVDRSRLTVRGVGPDQPLPGHRPSDPDNRRVEAELSF